jgi:hypothetical protein
MNEAPFDRKNEEKLQKKMFSSMGVREAAVQSFVFSSPPKVKGPKSKLSSR